MIANPTIFSFCEYLATALGCGVTMGIERQWRQHNAGLNTCALVTVGSALFVSLSVWTARDTNPTQAAAQVVTGVGFLCAGTILRSGLTIRGLNTAGTLWCTAAVGALAGLGLLIQAILGTIVVLFINVVLRRLANLINKQPSSGIEGERFYLFAFTCDGQTQSRLRKYLVEILESSSLRLQGLESREDSQSKQISLKATLAAGERADGEVERLANQLTLEPGVSHLRWGPLVPPSENSAHLESRGPI